MNGFDKLNFLASMSNETEEVSSSAEGPTLNTNSSTEDILDFIMLNLCSRLEINKLAFKGGYILSKIVPKDEVRATRDIDFSIANKEYYEVVKKILTSIGDELISLGVCDSYEVKDDIHETMSGGINYYMSDGSRHMGVDVGLHDISFGIRKININCSDINAFAIERMLSDKISAMFSRKRFRRSKDLYDFYILTSNFNVNMHDLNEFILKRAPLDFGASPLREEVLVEYKKAYDKLKLNGDNDQKELTEKPTFDLVISRLRLFIANLSSDKIWNCKLKEMEE